MSSLRPYDHVAREDRDPAATRRECVTCGAPVTGGQNGEELRHLGEAVRPVSPYRDDAPAVRKAFELAQRAVDERSRTTQLTPPDYARIVVDELYRSGALKTRLEKWRRRACQFN